jgi:hypothetical protein
MYDFLPIYFLSDFPFLIFCRSLFVLVSPSLHYSLQRVRMYTTSLKTLICLNHCYCSHAHSKTGAQAVNGGNIAKARERWSELESDQRNLKKLQIMQSLQGTDLSFDIVAPRSRMHLHIRKYSL